MTQQKISFYSKLVRLKAYDELANAIHEKVSIPNWFD